MIKFRPLKKFLKKFKILININYNRKLEDFFTIKTQIKSILSQSGILEAPTAESYFESLLFVFFLDLYFIYNENNDVENNEDNKVVTNDIIKTKNITDSKDNLFNITVKEDNNRNFKDLLIKLFTYCNYSNNHLIDKIFKKYEKNLKKNVISRKSKKIIKNFELRKTNFLLPVYIYMYKKEFKNIFFVLNLLSVSLINKFLSETWQEYFHLRVYSRDNEPFLLQKMLFLKLPYCFKLFDSIFKLNFKHVRNIYKLVLKFSLSSLVFLKIFKLTLLKNFQYLYSFYFNHSNIYRNFSTIFGTFLSFYDHFLFKKRKINFRRKIRKNILLENQYI